MQPPPPPPIGPIFEAKKFPYNADYFNTKIGTLSSQQLIDMHVYNGTPKIVTTSTMFMDPASIRVKVFFWGFQKRTCLIFSK